MKKIHALILSMLCGSSIIVGLTAPSLAVPDRGSHEGIPDMEWLLLNDYECERVGVNFIECEKDGEETEWCDDDGNCAEAPVHQTPVDPVYNAPIHEEGLLQQTPVDPVYNAPTRNAPIRNNLENRRRQNRY